MSGAWRAAGGRLGRRGGQPAAGEVATQKEGVGGGTMGSPALCRGGQASPASPCPTPGESGRRGRVRYPLGLAGWRASSTLFAVRFPSLSTMVTLTVSPGLCAAIMSRSSSTDVTFLPPSATIMSPPSW